MDNREKLRITNENNENLRLALDTVVVPTTPYVIKSHERMWDHMTFEDVICL